MAQKQSAMAGTHLKGNPELSWLYSLSTRLDEQVNVNSDPNSSQILSFTIERTKYDARLQSSVTNEQLR
jgi:hypothetical protein